VVIGVAGVIVSEDRTQFNFERGADVRLVVLQHPNEFRTGLVLHGAKPHIPGATVHEYRGANVPVDIGQELTR
jgi:hypothetical protein